MKTNQKTKTSTVTLLDGKSELACWTQNFENLPTVGERIDVTGRCGFPGYANQAIVVGVLCGQESEEPQLTLQAECEVPDRERPEIFLNANRVPVERRGMVETCARRELTLPLIHWEESFEPRAIVRLRMGKGNRAPSPVHLESKLTTLARREAASVAR
jgi:hypothetical protein